MNPARTFGSALSAGSFTALWLYFLAPPAGMLLATQAYVRLRGHRRTPGAKLRHDERHRCIFCEQAGPPDAAAAGASSGAPQEYPAQQRGGSDARDETAPLQDPQVAGGAGIP
jgi:hypothetical protein